MTLTQIELGLPIFFTIMGAWRGAWAFYTIAGFAWLLFGFNYWATSHELSLLAVVVAFVTFAGALWDRR